MIRSRQSFEKVSRITARNNLFSRKPSNKKFIIKKWFCNLAFFSKYYSLFTCFDLEIHNDKTIIDMDSAIDAN